MNRWGIGAGVVAFCLAAGAQAGEAGKAKQDDWVARVDKALDETLTNVKLEGQSLTDTLKALQGWTGVTVTLDPSAAKAAAGVKIDFTAKRMSARNVLGNVLRLAGGLRYTLADGAIYVSTTENVAAKLLTPATDAGPESAPMTIGEAAARRMERELATEGMPPVLGIVGSEWYGSWGAPRSNPATGITDFPGPSSVILRSEDHGDRRFWFSSFPYFVKPEYRGLVPQSLGDSIRTEVVRDRTDDTARKILKIIAENPAITGREILKRLRE